jgi:hypothetical protein
MTTRIITEEQATNMLYTLFALKQTYQPDRSWVHLADYADSALLTRKNITEFQLTQWEDHRIIVAKGASSSLG